MMNLQFSAYANATDWWVNEAIKLGVGFGERIDSILIVGKLDGYWNQVV